MTLIPPLDLQTLLVATLAGSTMIFVLIAAAMILFGASKFKMPLIALATIVMLFAIIIIPITNWLFVVSVIIVGLLVGYTLTRFQR